jgi:integrase/recombinase XerD
MGENERCINELVVNVINGMTNVLSNEQLVNLKNILYMNLNDFNIDKKSTDIVLYDNMNVKLLQMFLNTKRIEGKSDKTVTRYEEILSPVINEIGKNITDITTNDLRCYLANYQRTRNVCNNTLDGMRRIISSMFTWLHQEGYLKDNPAARLNKIKAEKKVKKIITDEELETLRMNCTTDRDIAMIDLFYCSGMRVSELSSLNICDVDFENKEIIVHGKGDKQRKVYIDGGTKIRLLKYLSSRTDNNPALFVTLRKMNGEPNRFTIRAIESRINTIATASGLENIYPHKFRRSMATSMASKNVNIYKISAILGHEKISTTQEYLVYNDNDIKQSYNICFG